MIDATLASGLGSRRQLLARTVAGLSSVADERGRLMLSLATNAVCMNSSFAPVLLSKTRLALFAPTPVE